MDLAVKTTIWLGLLAVSLFASAGTLLWAAGWRVLLGYVAVVLYALAKLDRDMMRERARPGPGVDRFDRKIAVAVALLLYPATFATAGFDFGFGWSPRMPLAVSLAALATMFLGYGLVLWAMHANRFFSTFVRIQTDRGHRLVDRGPYAWVRHPGYTGTIVAHLAMPIALESYAALAPAMLASGLFVARIAHEDRLLAANLEGYSDYQRRVRWRLLPGVW